jgi:hypothetical protein
VRKRVSVKQLELDLGLDVAGPPPTPEPAHEQPVVPAGGEKTPPDRPTQERKAALGGDKLPKLLPRRT